MQIPPSFLRIFPTTAPVGLPSVNLPGGGGSIPCTGHNSGECIGLAEEAESAGPMPESEVSHSPTVTGGA
jgi:hypothetical protein